MAEGRTSPEGPGRWAAVSRGLGWALAAGAGTGLIPRLPGTAASLLALGLFGVCLALAALHAVLVENQATLDDLLERNQQRYERIDKLQAEIAYLDSPEGLADQAHSAGLVPSAELAVLTPIGPDQLPPPEDDPFDLESSGRPPTPPTAQPPEAPELGKSAG